MVKSYNRKLFILLLILLGSLALYFTSQWSAKIADEDFLGGKLPHHITLNYKTLHIDFTHGDISFLQTDIKVLNRTLDSTQIKVIADEVSISDFHYLKFLFNKEIRAKELSVLEPEIIVYQKGKSTKAERQEIRLLKSIHIQDLGVVNGNLTVLNGNKETILSLDSLNLEIKEPQRM